MEISGTHGSPVVGPTALLGCFCRDKFPGCGTDRSYLGGTCAGLSRFLEGKKQNQFYNFRLWTQRLKEMNKVPIMNTSISITI